MKILYLAPLIPSVSGNGGKRAVFNHLKDVAQTTTDVDLMVIDVDDCGDSLPRIFDTFRGKVFRRALPRGRGPRGVLAAMAQWIFDARPRAAAVVASPVARRAVKDALQTGHYDLIVIDHLNAWSLLQHIETDVPIQYIAHNIESDVLRDQLAQCRRFSINSFRLSVELAKMMRYEVSLLQCASSVTTITATDYESDLLRAVRYKTVVWPELPDVKTTTWRSPGSRELLFVGSASYFPNRDAIEWLVLEFMPALNRLAPDVVLRIAGTSRADVPHLVASQNVIFEGFVPVERLDELHRFSDAFVCPVVLGSGIKIKVLEASSYGLPIVATAESLGGVDYLRGAALQIDRNAGAAAQAVIELLGDSERLQETSVLSIKQLMQARAMREPLVTVVAKLAFRQETISPASAA